MPEREDVQKAIDAHIKHIEDQITQTASQLEQFRNEFDQNIKTAIQWDGALPADPDNDVVAAVIAHYQTDESAPAQLNNIDGDLNEWLQNLQNSDPQRLQDIQQKANQYMKALQAEQSLPRDTLTLRTLTTPPQDEKRMDYHHRSRLF